MEFEKITNVISEQLGIPLENITMETTLTEDLDADSLDIFQIITELEEIFDIEFSNEAAEKLKSVGDVVEYIKKA